MYQGSYIYSASDYNQMTAYVCEADIQALNTQTQNLNNDGNDLQFVVTGQDQAQISKMA